MAARASVDVPNTDLIVNGWLVAIVLAERSNMFRKFSIECSHGTCEEPVPDHHPLLVAEVIDLLQTAIAIKDHAAFNPYAVNEIASIQVRLVQGIPGMECPRPIDGPVAERLNALEEAYVDWIQDPDTLFFKETPLHEESDIVVTLARLLQE
jgi:hypothetical protein